MFFGRYVVWCSTVTFLSAIVFWLPIMDDEFSNRVVSVMLNSHFYNSNKFIKVFCRKLVASTEILQSFRA